MLEPDLVVLPAPVATLGKNWDGTSIPPTLVAEIVSPSSRTRDYQPKRDFYVAGHALEYWIVDAERRVIVVARPGERDVTHTVELVWRPVRAAALHIDINALFAGLPSGE